MLADPSLRWKAGRVEKMRQMVEMTTNMQEMMATTLDHDEDLGITKYKATFAAMEW